MSAQPDVDSAELHVRIQKMKRRQVGTLRHGIEEDVMGLLPGQPGNDACQGNALLGEKGCETNGFGEFEKIAFWRTPKADCGNGRTDCVPYHEWVTNYIAVIGGR